MTKIVALRNEFDQLPNLSAFPLLRHLDFSFNRSMHICSDMNPDDHRFAGLNSLAFCSVRENPIEDNNPESFVQMICQHGPNLHLYCNVYTSNDDVAEGYRIRGLERGLIDREDYDYFKAKNWVPTFKMNQKAIIKSSDDLPYPNQSLEGIPH